ncbi:hypothetical protein F2P81_008626 [Scophthalmus maximus]|uniref:Uncharacterized protein n=1 Tax=Scophthalmus maximus TaxID=52904 RepID=A0A6A4T7F2_SCOMX|nr:hypothetical protein F2P81_008626 [Scophthalmus maximus]
MACIGGETERVAPVSVYNKAPEHTRQRLMNESEHETKWLSSVYPGSLRCPQQLLERLHLSSNDNSTQKVNVSYTTPSIKTPGSVSPFHACKVLKVIYTPPSTASPRHNILPYQQCQHGNLCNLFVGKSGGVRLERLLDMLELLFFADS